MSYLIALGIGFALGCVLTAILISPQFLEKYQNVNDIASKNWEAMKRAKEVYMNEDDEAEENSSDEDTSENDSQASSD